MHVDGLRGTLAQTDQSDGTLNKQMADGQNQRLARKLSGKTLSYVTASDDQYFDGVIDIARDVHAETHWGHIPFCRDKATALLRKAIEANNVSLIVATDKGTPMGFLYGSLGEYLVGLDNKLLTIQAIAIRREARSKLLGGRIALGLMSCAFAWGRQNNADEVILSVTSGLDMARTNQLLVRKFGFRQIGGNYARRL